MNVFNVQEKLEGKKDSYQRVLWMRNKWSASADLGLGLYQKLWVYWIKYSIY